jgi:hypothetical protein
MNGYFSSIGFKGFSKEEFDNYLYDEALKDPDVVTKAIDLDGNEITELRKEVAGGMGICMRGYFRKDDQFIMDYYFPYREASNTSNGIPTNVIPQTDREGFFGLCDDVRIGVDLIYFIQDMMPILMSDQRGLKEVFFGGSSFMALSNGGKILLPIMKKAGDEQKKLENVQKRSKLVAAAKNGDERAYEELTVNDMDLYNSLSKRLSNESLYEIVDTSFMPSGIESDKYSVIGEILNVRKFMNKRTRQFIYDLTLQSDSMIYGVCINEKDLLGEPEIGRRFKGDVWLQGKVNA